MSGFSTIMNELALNRDKKEFFCEEGFLAIPKGWSGTSEVLGADHTTFYLARSEDGF
jgi:hypothetical protein